MTGDRTEWEGPDADPRQALLLTTLRSIGDAVIVTDETGRVTLMNPEAERMTGWREAEAAGKPCETIFRITHETTGAVVESPIEKVLRLGAVVGLANHTVLTARDGTVHPIDDSGAPIVDADGNLRGVVLVFRDISDRRSQERALEESEARFRAVLDNAPSIVSVKDRAGRYTLVNRAFELLNGRSYEEVVGKTDAELSPAAPSASAPAQDRHVLETGEALQLEESAPLADRLATYLTTKFPLRDAAGEIYAVCGVSTDITRRKQEEVERQFLTEASAVLASSLDYETTLQRVADLAVPEIADWCSVDMRGDDGAIRQLAVAHVDPEKVKWAHELRKLYPPDPEETTGLPNVLRTGRAEMYTDIPDALLVAAARDERHLDVMRQIGFRSVIVVPITARGRVLGAITLVTTEESGHAYTPGDLTLAEGLASRAALAIDNARLYRAAQEEIAERQRVEEALRASEERFRFALANSDITVYSMDRDLRYTWVYNGRASGELLDIYGKTDEELLNADEAALLTQIKRRVLATGVEERHVARATRAGQEPGFYDTVFVPARDVDGNVIGVTGTVTDVTERVKTQDALARHQAEVEALNVRLQRSMRETHHRVKNNLQVITALIDMQRMQHGQSVPAAALARLTLHIQSLASIHDLLTRQARADTEVSSIPVGAIMEKLLQTLRGIGGRNITLAVEDIPLPVRQSTAMAVVVNELVSNAQKHGKGDIRVGFRVQDGWAFLEVTDEGTGFPADFDPANAANTGLDLISSLSQIDLNGNVSYGNAPGGGARIVVEFPYAEPS